ncbi:Rmf/CrpP family protein [Ferrimonas pelagia]|uniref:Uncharacterized protein n=1 Tax=Ferrimonas pelagia TaxID=1177826 RepID=A0ABP9EZ78_9GAMM
MQTKQQQQRIALGRQWHRLSQLETRLSQFAEWMSEGSVWKLLIPAILFTLYFYPERLQFGFILCFVIYLVVGLSLIGLSLVLIEYNARLYKRVSDGHHAATAEGQHAFSSGLSTDDCPYGLTCETQKRLNQYWLRGFAAAKQAQLKAQADGGPEAELQTGEA